MASNILIVLIAVYSTCVLGAPHPPGGPLDGPPGPHGPHGPHGRHHGPPPPPFLRNVTSDGRKAFFVIVKNENLTIGEIDTQVAAWAQTNGVLEQYNAFQANETVRSNAIKQNVTAAIANLPSVQTQLDALFSNKSLTRKAQREAIDALGEKYPLEMDNLFFLSEAAAEECDEHEGPRGPRRRPDGPGEFGESEGSEEFGGPEGH